MNAAMAQQYAGNINRLLRRVAHARHRASESLILSLCSPKQVECATAVTAAVQQLCGQLQSCTNSDTIGRILEDECDLLLRLGGYKVAHGAVIAELLALYAPQLHPIRRARATGASQAGTPAAASEGLRALVQAIRIASEAVALLQGLQDNKQFGADAPLAPMLADELEGAYVVRHQSSIILHCLWRCRAEKTTYNARKC